MRQAPAVSFSSGELLLLSHSHVWNGVSDFYSGFYFGYSTLLSELDGGNCSYVDGQRSEESGEEATAQILSQLGPVPSPGAINFTCAKLQGNLMAGMRVPPGSPTGGGPHSGSSPRTSHGEKMADGAIPRRTTAQDSNRMPRPVRVLFVRCAAAPYQCFSVNSVFPEGRLLLQVLFYEPVSRRPTFGPARCAKRQQVAISAGVRGRSPLGVQELLYGDDVSFLCLVPVCT